MHTRGKICNKHGYDVVQIISRFKLAAILIEQISSHRYTQVLAENKVATKYD